ncbi:bifunctional glutamate N-acetyltransferase/amino-acid acetyltransferase ArgJ [Candidatus Woesearchaeota archaeon]|nr:bifunctional glutamate N-acetyltransferase/amino-acid acetyltransferase ArgJ [Candidatus Woesearchaeota archaeon]
MIKMKLLKNNVCAPKGFMALSKSIGIKKSGKPDLTVIFSQKPANAAAVYTSNNVKGAPLIVTKEHLMNGKAQAIVVNSGVANVCTGLKGIDDARETAKTAAKELGIRAKDVLIASTGLIGAYLPMSRIKTGLKGIKKQLSITSDAAAGIMTTDTAKKEIAVKLGNFTIGAVAKGSGMIHPNMATMLCFITTDADIPSAKLQNYLKSSVGKSFNMISVDMDTSTSDMAILMANGLAGKVNEKKFQDALDFVCIEMAKKIAMDGEGATKLVEVEVKNADSHENAGKLAKSVISSNLVKCALFGNDPNWGRIVCAMGNSGVNFNHEKIDVFFGDEAIVRNGTSNGFDLKKVKDIMAESELKITIDLKSGTKNAVAYGCDMSFDYVKINAAYTT